MANAQTGNYSVSRSSGVCAFTGEPLNVGDPIVAVLVEHPGEDELKRVDFSARAWADGHRPEAPARVFGVWKSRVPDSVKPTRPLIDDAEALDLFEQLGAVTEPRRVAFRFLLALVLMRKKILIYEGGRPVDNKHGVPGELRVRVKGTPPPPEGPEPIVVIDPGLDEDALEAAKEELAQVMNLDEQEPARKSTRKGAARRGGRR